MGRLAEHMKNAVRKADLILLLLCVVATAFGCLIISSAIHDNPLRYVVVQAGAALIGVFLFFIVSSIDSDFLSEHRGLLVAFNCFMLLLIIPFGTDNGTGNKSWLDIPLLPFNIQPT